MQDFCKAPDHFQTLEKGYCGRGEHFHMEQNLVPIVVSAYDLSGKQSEAWLSEEEVANRCSSEPCYQCRWAATLEWELYLHCPTSHEVTPPIIAFPMNRHASRIAYDQNQWRCRKQRSTLQCHVLGFPRIWCCAPVCEKTGTAWGSRVVGKKPHEMVLIRGQF
jgi:hypothetical protein